MAKILIRNHRVDLNVIDFDLIYIDFNMWGPQLPLQSSGGGGGQEAERDGGGGGGGGGVQEKSQRDSVIMCFCKNKIQISFTPMTECHALCYAHSNKRDCARLGL